MDRLITPEQLKHPKIGQIHFAHAGSGKKADAYLDAKYHAQSHGTYAVAVNHPGGGRVLPHPLVRKRINEDYESAAAHEVVGAMRLLRNQGVEAIVFLARSAGVSAELAAAKAMQKPEFLNEDLPPIVGIYGAESVAWDARSVKQGHQDYNQYNNYQTMLLRKDAQLPENERKYVHPIAPGLPPLASAVRMARIVPYMVFDKYHNADHWASDDASQIYAPYVARMMPDTMLQLDFAEISMGATQSSIQESKKLLEGDRFRRDEAPLHVTTVEGTVHSSFDLRSFFSERMTPVVQWAIEQV